MGISEPWREHRFLRRYTSSNYIVRRPSAVPMTYGYPPQFMEDFTKLNDELREVSIATVAVFVNTKYPNTCDYPFNDGELYSY